MSSVKEVSCFLRWETRVHPGMHLCPMHACMCARAWLLLRTPVCTGVGGACSGRCGAGTQGGVCELEGAIRQAVPLREYSFLLCVDVGMSGGFTGLGVYGLVSGCVVCVDLGVGALQGWLTRAVCEWGVLCLGL